MSTQQRAAVATDDPPIDFVSKPEVEEVVVGDVQQAPTEVDGTPSDTATAAAVLTDEPVAETFRNSRPSGARVAVGAGDEATPTLDEPLPSGTEEPWSAGSEEALEVDNAPVGDEAALLDTPDSLKDAASVAPAVMPEPASTAVDERSEDGRTEAMAEMIREAGIDEMIAVSHQWQLTQRTEGWVHHCGSFRCFIFIGMCRGSCGLTLFASPQVVPSVACFVFSQIEFGVTDYGQG